MNEYPKPFRHNMFDPIEKRAAAVSAKEQPEKAKIPLNAEVPLSSSDSVSPIAQKLWIIANGDKDKPDGVSQPFNDLEDYDKPIDDKNHFNFAPGIDEVSIAWKVENEKSDYKIKLELYCASDKTKTIWTGELQDETVTSKELAINADDVDHTGCISWDGFVKIPKTKIGKDDNAFPDECVTVEHAPYQLRMLVIPKGEDESKASVAWTYFDVLIHSVDLLWGTSDIIPAGDRTDIKAENKVTINDAEKDILAELAKSGRKPTAASHRIHLVSNVFAKSLTEYQNNELYGRYRDLWGSGPRIPIMAQVTIKKSNDDPVEPDKADKAAVAIGNTKFLWDWRSKEERDDSNLQNAYDADNVRSFLKNTLDYKTAGDGVAPPGSDNCHKDHGGKRGGDPIFPEQSKDVAPQLVNSKFPFRVEACPERKWAVFSYARTGGDYAGKTGVVFQPSRMAKDTYQLTAYLAKYPDELDNNTDPPQKLADENPKLLQKSTGVFEVWRKIHARYIRKNQNLAKINTDHIAEMYEKAGIVFEYRSVDDYFLRGDFNRYLQEVLDDPVYNPMVDKAKVFLAPLAPDFDQYTGDYGLTYPSWEEFREACLARAVEEYAFKKRFINNKKRKFRAFVQEYKLRHAECGDNEAKAKWFDTLSKDSKDKVEAKLGDILDGYMVRDEGSYKGACGNVSKNILQNVSEKYRNDKINDEGIAFFHYEYKHAYSNKDGTIEIEQTDVGGIAPSHRNRTGDKTMFLLYMPSADNPDRMDPKDVAAHEVAHNLFLCHAPPKLEGGKPDYHVENDDCLMNYERANKHLCGFCLLRLRGWSVAAEDGCVKLSNKGAENKG